jgi:cellulose biosynthesis protein BcsQ
VALSIALVSPKGGVGKTTTVVNLATLAAAGGVRTLVWDLDPQGSASYLLGFEKRGGGATRHLTRKRPRLGDGIFATPSGIDLIPADTSLRTLDIELAAGTRSRKRVGEALESVDRTYDVVFLDCPAGITLANESAIRAADVYLSPIVPSLLAVRAFSQLADHVARDRRATGRLMGFLSMVDQRKRSHRDLADQLRRDDLDVLRTVIPTSTDAETLSPGARRARARSRCALAYRDLWTDVQTAALGRHIDLVAEESRAGITAGTKRARR